MKPNILITYCLLTAAMGGVQILAAQTLSESEIGNQADARIQKYRTGDVQLRLVTPKGKAVKRGKLVSIEQTRHSFLFGSNIFMLGGCKTAADNAAYEKEFSGLLNYATVPLYWWDYEREAGHPDYESTARMAAWCAAHHITVKGHPLAWNYVDPDWLPSDPAEDMRFQMQRITDIVGRLKGQVDFFDVVNEATNFAREETLQHAPKLTAGIEQMGVPAYLRTAFSRARAANPQAALVINDYVTTDDYLEKVISQLVDASGRPLFDVIGIQCHQHENAWSAEKIWEICERFAKVGKPLHFTEATLLSGQPGWGLKQKHPEFDWASTPEGEQRQAEEVVRFYTILFSHPAVEAITWWDFSDQGAWQEAPAGLVRADMTPKPAYDALMKLIKGKWWTRTEVRTSRQGAAQFHGFYGDYRVSVNENGRQLTGTFTINPKTPQPVEVKVN
ncbi:MAG: endo-1,4-beta-xylanase [Terriglobia bacterium]|jgi:GH35 family endo-1,4-beta-xylanase